MKHVLNYDSKFDILRIREEGRGNFDYYGETQKNDFISEFKDMETDELKGFEIWDFMKHIGQTVVEIHYIKDNDLPKVSDEDLLLFINDSETDKDEPYHCEVGYYRGKEGNNGDLMFDNCYHGWVQGEVIAWCKLPKIKIER